MKNAKKYDIDTFSKLLNVLNTENFDRLMVDFATCAGIYIQVCNEIRKKCPENKEKLNSELLGFKSFTGIDDGKVGIESIIVHSSETGEMYEIENKSPRVSLK